MTPNLLMSPKTPFGNTFNSAISPSVTIGRTHKSPNNIDFDDNTDPYQAMANLILSDALSNTIKCKKGNNKFDNEDIEIVYNNDSSESDSPGYVDIDHVEMERFDVDNNSYVDNDLNMKYEIEIFSAPLGIVFESNENGYNMIATEITEELTVIKKGMILSDINDENSLGLPFIALKMKLLESMYPIKLSFISQASDMKRKATNSEHMRSESIDEIENKENETLPMHPFISKLKFIKTNDKELDTKNSDHFYWIRHLKAAMNEYNFNFIENEMDEIIAEIMNIEVCDKSGITLICDCSLNTFINSVGISKPAKNFLNLINHGKSYKIFGLDLASKEITEESLEIARVADILADRLNDNKYKNFRENLPTQNRRDLLKYYYPLPPFLKPIAKILFIILSVFATAVILFYGLKFDILYYATIPNTSDIYLQSQCPSTLKDMSATQLMQYSIDNKAVEEYEEPNLRGDTYGSFSEDATDSQRFFGVIGLSVVQSLLIWQPCIILFFTLLFMVNYIAGKSADMSLMSYIVAFIDIITCTVCKNYRKYIVKQTILSDPNSDLFNLSTILEKGTSNNEPKTVELGTMETFSMKLENPVPVQIQKRLSVFDKVNNRARKRLQSFSGENSKTNEITIISPQSINIGNPMCEPVNNLSPISKSISTKTNSITYSTPRSYQFIKEFDTIYNDDTFSSLANLLKKENIIDAFGDVLDSIDENKMNTEIVIGTSHINAQSISLKPEIISKTETPKSPLLMNDTMAFASFPYEGPTFGTIHSVD
eukprot:342315_1